MTSTFLRSFAAGEIAPSMRARVDQVKYQTGLDTCRNWFTRLEGGAVNRSGTQFVCPLLRFATGAARMFPFVFNDEQSYILLVAYNGVDVRFTVTRDGFPILEAASKVITGITATTPPVATSVAHGFTDGKLIYVDGVDGMTEVNGRFFRVGVTTANTFELWEEAAVVGAGFTAYASGGTATEVYSEILTGVTEDMIAGMRWAQNADVITLTTNEMPILDITRFDEDDWRVTFPEMTPDIDAPIGVGLTGTAGADVLRYRVTAVADDTLEESFGSTMATVVPTTMSYNFSDILVTKVAHGLTTGDTIVFDGTTDLTFALYFSQNGKTYRITVATPDLFTLDGTNTPGLYSSSANLGTYARDAIVSRVLAYPTALNPVTVTWLPVTGALDYNIYREVNGIYAYIGTAVGTTFEDQDYPADAFDTPPVDTPVFNAAGRYPLAVGYHQQRKLYGGSEDAPEETRASRIGLFRNFTKSNPIQSDDAITFTAAANKVNEVRHFVEMGRLLMFTQGAIFTIEGDDSGTLTPTAIHPRKRAEHGVGDVTPIPIGTAVVYLRKSGKIVGEISTEAGDAFPTRDLTIYSKHLFKRYGLVAMSYAEEPYSIVWGVRSDGVLVGMTYLREHEVLGWHRHDTGAGDEFLDVCCIPENNETATYVLVRRYDCNGQTRVYLERMASREVVYVADGRFLDSFTVTEAANEDVAQTYTLQWNGELWLLEGTGTTTPFVDGDDSPDIGRVILVYGPDGERIWCTVSSVLAVPGTPTQYFAVCQLSVDNQEWVTGESQEPNDGEDADGEDDDTEPFPFDLPYVTSDWSASTARITNLWHLEGRTVRAMGDGQPFGELTVSGGAVDLPAPAVVVVVGLSITADLKTLDIDVVDNETLADKRKQTGKTTIMVESTNGLSVGLTREGRQPWDVEWAREWAGLGLYTGRLSVACSGKVDDSGYVFLRQSEPLPATVLGIIPTVSVGRA